MDTVNCHFLVKRTVRHDENATFCFWPHSSGPECALADNDELPIFRLSLKETDMYCIFRLSLKETNM